MKSVLIDLFKSSAVFAAYCAIFAGIALMCDYN